MIDASAPAAAPGRFLGWWVVAAVFLLLMTTSGLSFYGLALYLEAITTEQSLSTTVVSLATSMFFVIGGVTGRVIAPAIERFDLRWIVLAGAICSAVSLTLLGSVTTAGQLFAVYALFAVGFAAAGLVPATTLITRWFHTRRSVALAIASTGLSVGGLTFTRFAAALIDRRGLAEAAPWLGAVFLGSSLLALVCMWPDPASRGQVPDGVPRSETRNVAANEGATHLSYDQAIRTRFFVAICGGFVFVMGAQVGAIAQLAKLGAERVDRSAGTLAISVMAGASVAARLAGGVVARHIPLIGFIAVLSLLQALALAWFALAGSVAALVVAAAIFGATIGNLLMLQPLIIAEAFGVGMYARVFAFQQLIVTAGVAMGPFLLGWLRDASSYRTSYLAAAGLSVVGAIVFTQSGVWRPSDVAAVTNG